MSKFYIEAYYPDGTQILGNLDGQTVIHASDYRRTNHYKNLKGKLSAGIKFTRAKFFRVVDARNHIIEQFDNINYRPRAES